MGVLIRRAGLKAGNWLEVVAGKLRGLLCPFGKKVLYMKDRGYSQEIPNYAKLE